jgi:hypothetical protein
MTYFYSETINLAYDSGCFRQVQPIIIDFLAGEITKQDLESAPTDLGVILASAAWERDLTLFDRIPHSVFTAWASKRGIPAPVENRLAHLGFYQQELVNMGLISDKDQASPLQTERDGLQMFDLNLPESLGEPICYDEEFAQIVLQNADKITRYKRSLNDPYQHLEERTMRILGYALTDKRIKRQFIKSFGRTLFSDLTAKMIIDDNTMPNVKSELFELQDYLGLTNIVISKHTVQFRYPFASIHRLAQFDDPKELQEFLDLNFPNSSGSGGYYKTGVITFEKAALLCEYCDFTLLVNGEQQGFDTYSLKDIQGGNLGDIESEVFERLESVIDRLENYFLDQNVIVNEYGNIVSVPEEQGIGRWV